MIMAKNFLYFQPEYVDKFKCDGSKCNARCCKGWTITIDDATYKKYSQIKPKEKTEEILSCMKFDSERKEYVMTLKPNGFCPMLTEKNLCRLQANYGEKFLSQTCATYPRYTNQFGDFFERSLTLSCPVAAEMILFEKEPIKFFFVNVDEKVHSNGGKIFTNPFSTKKFLAEELFAIQGTMISILQERRLSINQRLLALGFFVYDLEELMAINVSSPEESLELVRAVKKLTASYNPKIFLREGVPPALEKFSFDAEKFVMIMISFFSPIYVGAFKSFDVLIKYLHGVVELLHIDSADKPRLTFKEIAENYTALAGERKNFSEKFSTFLENYLVNEFFLNICPWKFKGGVVKNFLVFMISYKVFELIIFSATLKSFDTKEDLLCIVDRFTRKIDHNEELKKKILEFLKDRNDLFELTESLLEQ